MDALVYSDGGKNNEKGCYGSFLVIADGEEKRKKEFTFSSAKTAPEAETLTLIEALTYIKHIDTQVPGRVNWEVALDAQWLFEHLTADRKRKVAKKFVQLIDQAKIIIDEYEIEISQVSGGIMKRILGH